MHNDHSGTVRTKRRPTNSSCSRSAENGGPKAWTGPNRNIADQHRRIGFAIVAVAAFLAIFGPLITRYPPTDFHLADRLTGPSVSYFFGTDEFGRDVFSRVVAGARSIVWIAVIGTLLGIILGTMVGLTSAYMEAGLTSLSCAVWTSSSRSPACCWHC